MKIRQDILNAAQYISDNTGIPLQFVLAQFNAESGSRGIWTKEGSDLDEILNLMGYNLGGQKWGAWSQYPKNTWEEMTSFIRFPNLMEYAKSITEKTFNYGSRGQITKEHKFTNDVESYLDYLIKIGYVEGLSNKQGETYKNYKANMTNFIKKLDSGLIENGGSSLPQPPFDKNNFWENLLKGLFQNQGGLGGYYNPDNPLKDLGVSPYPPKDTGFNPFEKKGFWENFLDPRGDVAKGGSIAEEKINDIIQTSKITGYIVIGLIIFVLILLLFNITKSNSVQITQTKGE